MAGGVDLFDCAFVPAATAGGYALSFPTTSTPAPEAAGAAPEAAGAGPEAAGAGPGAEAAGAAPEAGSSERDQTKMNMWSLAYRCGGSSMNSHIHAFTHLVNST